MKSKTLKTLPIKALIKKYSLKLFKKLLWINCENSSRQVIQRTIIDIFKGAAFGKNKDDNTIKNTT